MKTKFLAKVAARIIKEKVKDILVFETCENNQQSNKSYDERMHEKLTNKEDVDWIESSIRDYKENYNLFSDKEKEEKFNQIFNAVKTRVERFALVLIFLPKDNTIKGIIKKQKLEDLLNYYQSMKEELLKFKTCA